MQRYANSRQEYTATPQRGAIIEIIKHDLASQQGVSRHQSRNSYLTLLCSMHKFAAA